LSQELPKGEVKQVKERETNAISNFERAANPQFDEPTRFVPGLPVRVISGRQYSIDIHNEVFRDIDEPGKAVRFNSYEGWQLTGEPISVSCPYCGYPVVTCIESLMGGEDCPRCFGVFNTFNIAGWSL
jgi:hypothetical protein